MHVLPRRPPEPEQRDGDAETPDAGGEETLLGGDVAVGVEVGFEAIAAEVGEAFGGEGEVVDAYEDYDEAVGDFESVGVGVGRTAVGW